MSTAMPEPVDRFISAVNAGDTESFLAFFPQDGVVDDWGRRFVGHDAIKGWSDREFIGAEGRMTVTRIDVNGDEASVDADWRSNHFTGPSRFVFTLRGDQIEQMRITEA